MFFLLRSVFWLGIVFSYLPWGGESAPASPAHMIEAARSAISGTADSTRSYCTASPMECLAAAQKLHELFEKVSAETDFIPEGDPPAPPARSGLSAKDRAPKWRAAQ